MDDEFEFLLGHLDAPLKVVSRCFFDVSNSSVTWVSKLIAIIRYPLRGQNGRDNLIIPIKSMSYVQCCDDGKIAKSLIYKDYQKPLSAP